ncbi:MAG: MaoC family dehydratase [Alphaproteobacteria bacterium]|nr:MaoC family dehydratase [Alphaproteobacteria bacterium]
MTTGRYLEDLKPGDSESLTRTVTAADIDAFASVTGDDNPVHLDEAYAATTRFGGRIAHGMLSAGYISAVLGTRLPGPGAIYLSQTVTFRRPVRIGDEVVTTATVTAIDAERARVTLSTVCTVAGKTVTEGEAVVMAPRRAASGEA